MCGIFGYIGFRKASPILLKGIKRLEYRGYDSCGIATLSKKIFVKKGKGKIDEVNKILNFLSLPGNLGIAHTRWATHGKVNDINAHPHLDCSKKIAIVHNGIIENFLEIRKMLERKGHKFESETDSEVIAHYVEELMKEGYSFEEASRFVFLNLKGSFAILAINENEEKIIAIRKDSPLVLGIGENEFFISSDIPALLEFTNKVVYLSNYDFVVLTKNSFKIENLVGKKRKIEIEEISFGIEDVEKGNYEHYMIKEILEQSQTIKRAILQNKEKIENFAKEIKKAKKIFLVAAGTSYHASLAASYIFSKYNKIFASAILASEFKHFVNSLNKNDLIIAISQSGETADVLEAVRIAKKKGIKVLAITNVNGSSLTKEADDYLLMNAGIEIGVAATKTYVSQLSLIILLSYALNGKLEDGINKLKAISDISLELTAKSFREYVKKIAEKLKEKEHIFLIGRGLEFVTALEAALKIKEISYIHAEAFAGGEIKHGTIALIENETPVIVFDSKENHDEIISNAIELKARGAFIIGVSSKRNEVFDIWLKVPENGIANCILQIIPMQLLAYYLAKIRGYDPDKPRNLAKSVTVK
ncbi:MAG: glutamine--fructose-6-phosphate transaminase (isomerizing) [Candidatus Aenigmarchaeota archaeon ex4484_224]|nr:MAG: glutamine--fructose-6-phosphate transaminase (isomerizing) [Candidatus Aenigmarchaeota archaeon ex4484_224]